MEFPLVNCFDELSKLKCEYDSGLFVVDIKSCPISVLLVESSLIRVKRS